MKAIGAVPAIKDCDVESILAIAGTTTVANTDTAIFAEDAHHFATSDLYNLELNILSAFLITSLHCLKTLNFVLLLPIYLPHFLQSQDIPYL